MAKVGSPAEPPEAEKPEPAVSVRRSIQPDHLLCLVCGKPQKILKRHLAVQHELTPPEYRSRFELRPDYPMIAPNYAQQRREVALKLGLGRPKKAAAKRRKAPARPRKAAPGRAAAAQAGILTAAAGARLRRRPAMARAARAPAAGPWRSDRA